MNRKERTETRWSIGSRWNDGDKMENGERMDQRDKRKEEEKIECMDKNMKGQREDERWRGRSDDEGQ